MRRLAFISALSGVILIACIVFSIGFGKRRPLAKSFYTYHLTECAPPCWMNIQPGSTNFDSARERIVSVFTSEYDIRLDEVYDNYRELRDGSSKSVITQSIILTLKTDDYLNIPIELMANPENRIMEGISIASEADPSDVPLPTLGELIGVYGIPDCIQSYIPYIIVDFYDQNGNPVLRVSTIDDRTALQQPVLSITLLEANPDWYMVSFCEAWRTYLDLQPYFGNTS
jgi:hypothetical protein